MVTLSRTTSESPRLLLTQNRVKDAETIIRRINSVNGTPVPSGLSEELQDIAEALQSSTDLGCHGIISSARLTIYIALITIAW